MTCLTWCQKPTASSSSALGSKTEMIAGSRWARSRPWGRVGWPGRPEPGLHLALGKALEKPGHLGPRTQGGGMQVRGTLPAACITPVSPASLQMPWSQTEFSPSQGPKGPFLHPPDLGEDLLPRPAPGQGGSPRSEKPHQGGHCSLFVSLPRTRWNLAMWRHPTNPSPWSLIPPETGA